MRHCLVRTPLVSYEYHLFCPITFSSRLSRCDLKTFECAKPSRRSEGHRRTECCCATQLNVPTSGRVLGLCAQDPREGGKGLRESQRGAGSYSRRDRSVRPGTGHHHARDGHTAEKTRAGARVRGTGDPRHRYPDPKVGPVSGSYREMADEARRATSILRMYVAEILVPCKGHTSRYTFSVLYAQT